MVTWTSYGSDEDVTYTPVLGIKTCQMRGDEITQRTLVEDAIRPKRAMTNNKEWH